MCCARLRSSLLTRTWPNAGCSNARPTVAASIAGAVRIPQIRLPAGLLEQGFDAARLDRLLVPVECVAGLAHDLAGLRHVAELLSQPQQANLVFDHRSMCTHLGVPFWSIPLRLCGPQPGYPASSAAEEVSDHIATTANECNAGDAATCPVVAVVRYCVTSFTACLS